ncbi:MAG: DUF2290 domain-containing protein [Methylobacter sp.]
MNLIASHILEEFQFFLDALIDRELLIDSNSLIIQSSERGTSISWSNSTGLSYLFSDYSNFEQYIEILNRRDFSLCFYDGGLIQINYFIADNQVKYHRLCYIPCPFKYEASDWTGISLSEIPSMMSESDLLRDTRLASPIRFDFDVSFTDEKHAHSHVSINKQSCRIPAYGPISLGHFFRFVLRYFYEDHFDADNSWAGLRPRLYSRTLNYPSPHEFHIESAVGNV